jgi:hypothetical protein
VIYEHPKSRENTRAVSNDVNWLTIGNRTTRLRRAAPLFNLSLRRVPAIGELFDVVDQAEKLQLPIDFDSPEQHESIQPLVVPNVCKDRLDGREALRVLSATRG